MKRQTLRTLHRWVGLIFSLTILMASGSGILHTIMSRTQAPPPSARPASNPIEPSKITVSIPEAVAVLPGQSKAVTHVNLRNISGEPWYQIYRAGSPMPDYVSAQTGQADAAQDERYAEEIASAFLGIRPGETEDCCVGKPQGSGSKNARKTKLVKADYLTAYNSEYIAIFRILPVYRFNLNDGKETRVYVSTATGSVTRHTDRRRQFEADVFSLLHKYNFIRNKDWRDAFALTVTGGAFVVSCLGVALFFVTRRKKKLPENEQES